MASQLKLPYGLRDGQLWHISQVQDASGAMLDWFFKQAATKVILGDAHQQIYGWRHAVNSLNKADFMPYHLSASFRFGASLAELATQVLAWKAQLGADTPYANLEAHFIILIAGNSTGFARNLAKRNTNAEVISERTFVAREKIIAAVTLKMRGHMYD